MLSSLCEITRNLAFSFILLVLTTGCAAKFDYKDPVVNMPMVFVKGGSYMMGSDNHPSEQPVHEVTVSDLFVGIYEVTFDQYDHFCKATNCESPSDEGWGRGNRPVINVSWEDANAYAKWLSDITGYQYRLPTESEWEYFARAGTKSAYWTGDNFTIGSANCANCGSKWDNKMTAPAGSFNPNPWGIFDTMGNVSEWVLDDYQKDYIYTPVDGSPLKITDSTKKSQRSGAWSYNKRYLESAARDYRRSNSHKNDTGFRLVLIPNETIMIVK